MESERVYKQISNIFTKSHLDFNNNILINSQKNQQVLKRREEENQYLFLWGSLKEQYNQHQYHYIHFPYRKICKICCGYDIFSVLTQNGEIYEINKNGSKYHKNQKIMKIQLQNKKRIIGIVRGKNHNIAWNNQEIYGWGQNTFGALGHDDYQKIIQKPKKIPFLVPLGQKIQDIKCGNNTTIIKVSEDYYGFGDNRKGQLGFILKNYTSQPQIIKVYNQKGNLVKNIKSIKIGYNFIIALDDDDYFYGSGQLQQLGLGNCSGEGLQFIDKVNRSIKGQKIIEYECKRELYILYEDRLVIYGNLMGRIYRQIKLKQKGIYRMKVGRQFGFLINENITYSWGYSQQKNLRSSKQVLSQVQINHNFNDSIMDCNENYGLMITSDKECQKLIKFFQTNLQTVKFKKQFKQRQRQKQKQDIMFRNNNILESLKIEKQTQKQLQILEIKISKLEKQNKEQKQIIGLFQRYVKKLQIQNSNLKILANASNKSNLPIQQNDQISCKIKDLKVLLSNILQQQQQY